MLPITYYSQAKAWMTGDMLKSILSKLNRQMVSNGHKISLFMDNAACNPEELRTKFSNIHACFRPPPPPLTVQPLDLGIIQNFKVYYRQLFLQYVISKIDECDKASDVVKSVNLLTIIRWVALAWSNSICKCFRKAGILDTDLDMVSRDADDNDPFWKLSGTK